MTVFIIKTFSNNILFHCQIKRAIFSLFIVADCTGCIVVPPSGKLPWKPYPAIYFLDLICVNSGVFKRTSKPAITALSGSELECEMQLPRHKAARITTGLITFLVRTYFITIPSNSLSPATPRFPVLERKKVNRRRVISLAAKKIKVRETSAIMF